MPLSLATSLKRRISTLTCPALCLALVAACGPDGAARSMRAPLGENEPPTAAREEGTPGKPRASAPVAGSGARPRSQAPGNEDADPADGGTERDRDSPRPAPQRPGSRDAATDAPPVGSDARVRINEVACRNAEFVELINRGGDSADLSHFAISDRTDPGAATRLAGILAPGERASFAYGGLACDEEPAVLFEDDTVIDQVRPPLMPATASFARLPDAEGEFALATPTPEAPNRAFDDEAARLFLDLEARVPQQLPELHIRISQQAFDSLRGVTTDSPRPWLAATLTFSDARGEVGPISTGIHLKGRSVFRDIDGKPAFRLDFDRFEDGNSLFGIENLTLNNFVQDPSASHERVYYGLLARNGLPAPRVGYINVWVNDQPFGVYLALESTNEQSFLGRSFASTDLVYEGTYGMDLYTTYIDQFDEDYGAEPGRATLAHLIDVLEGVDESTLLADTDDLIDWDRVTVQMAADLVAGHYDSYTANRNNFSFHFDDQHRLSLISSGPDQAFEQPAQRSADGSRLMGHCLSNAACTRALDYAIAYIAADTREFLAAGGAQRLRSDAARLSAAFADDPRIEWSDDEVERFVDDMLAFIERNARAQ